MMPAGVGNAAISRTAMRSARTPWLSSRAVLVLLIFVGPLATSGAADKKLQALASVEKQIKGTSYFQVSYKRPVGSPQSGKKKSKRSDRPKKVKTVKTKAYVTIGAELSLHRDRPGRIEELKAGETLFILGKPEELEVVSKNFGQAVGKERFIRKGTLLVTGEGVSISKTHRSRDPRFQGLQWCKVTVDRAGSKRGISVVYEGQKHFATLEKGFRMIVREKIERDGTGPPRGKLLRRGARLALTADDKTPRFDDKELPKRDLRMYRATKVVVVYRGAIALYGDILPLE